MNYHLARGLGKYSKLSLICLRYSQKLLPIWLPYSFVKAVWILATQRIDIVHLGDALLSPLGLTLKVLFNIPVTVTAHGKDVIWNLWIYQKIIPWSLKRLDKICCVSTQTAKECMDRGIDQTRIDIIPNGVDPFEFYLDETKENVRQQLSRDMSISLNGYPVLLSVGRLVARKGFHWFIEEVMPMLLLKQSDIRYVLIGYGPFYDKILKIVKIKQLENNVCVLGRVNEEVLKMFYNASDIFLMPNIPIKWDMEGFGLVAIEASSCGLPVIASNIEGIKDAVTPGENGFLVNPYDRDGFIHMIVEVLKNQSKTSKTRIREATLKKYSWEKICDKYLNVFDSLVIQ